MDTAVPPLVVVDTANTVGSVPDGWWRDRHSATERLRDALAALAEGGLPERADVPAWAQRAPLGLLLVVEGAVRDVRPVPGVRIEAAPGSGDDLIVELVALAARETPGRPCLVVTADRELRDRVALHGAAVASPRAVRPDRPQRRT